LRPRSKTQRTLSTFKAAPSRLELFLKQEFFLEEKLNDSRLMSEAFIDGGAEGWMEQRAVMPEPIIDERVIEACRQGDREAFGLLFEAYKDRVFSIAVYSFHGDEAAASDVAQQIFLKLMTTIAQYRGDSAFTTWLYRLVVNACIDERRKRKRFLSFEEFVPPSRSEEKRPQEKNYARAELADSVKAAIGDLKPKLRMPILLKYIEGLSYAEIGEVLGCSMGTVASRLNRGHKALASRLSHLRDHVLE
jgi:RNA polymerase sigma-70 factor, ECF subfamily